MISGMGKRAEKHIAGIVGYMIEKGETLDGAITTLENILDPSDRKTLRRRIINAYCFNKSPTKATKIYDPSKVRFEVKSLAVLK